MALGVLIALVVGVVQLVQLVRGGEPPEPERAAPVAGSTTPTTSVDATPAESPDRDGKGATKNRGKGKKQKDKGPVLADPEGPCVDSDIAVTPTAKQTVGGSPVTFLLELRTISSPACTWQVSPDTLTVKITSGKDDIWSSRDCPRAIPTKNVVVRSNVSTPVEFTWSARRSDEECSQLTDWALPGWYHIDAAALGGEPSDLQFELTAPKPEVVTETVKPEDGKGKNKEKNRDEDAPDQDQEKKNRDGQQRDSGDRESGRNGGNG